MAQLKRPFAVRFKHCWSHEPIWETFWTQTSEQAMARAKMLYSDIDSKTEVQIIKIVPLAMNEAIMPPDIRKYNEVQMYKPLRIEHTGPYGLDEALDAMRLPKNSDSDSLPGGIGPKDARLANALIIAGDDHAKAMRGIDVHLKIWLQVGFMIELETYRYGVECLSTSSTMHGELKAMRGQELASQKQTDLPKKVYVRRLKISYQALRRIYRARRKHRHPDWQIWCDFIETLPFFSQLIMPEIVLRNKHNVQNHKKLPGFISKSSQNQQKG